MYHIHIKVICNDTIKILFNEEFILISVISRSIRIIFRKYIYHRLLDILTQHWPNCPGLDLQYEAENCVQ